jgi:hypothetical protein
MSNSKRSRRLNVPGHGALPRSNRLGDDTPIFEDSIEVIPRAELRQLYDQYEPSQRWTVQKIKNQGQEGSCASNSGTSAWENAAVAQFGQRIWFELSAISLYKRVGRSPQSGSTLNDNIRELSTRGALPTNAMRDKLESIGLNPAHTMPETGFYSAFPSGWEDTAKHFRIVPDEIFDIRGMDGFLTALFRGFCVYYGRASHAIIAVAAEPSGSRWKLEYQNSWGASWDGDGFGYDEESFVSGAIASYGAYAVRTVSLSDALAKLVFDQTSENDKVDG